MFGETVCVGASGVLDGCTWSTQALKGLALLRLGRPDDAATMVDGVIDAMPGDTATLQAVTMYCRELGDCELILLNMVLPFVCFNVLSQSTVCRPENGRSLRSFRQELSHQ